MKKPVKIGISVFAALVVISTISQGINKGINKDDTSPIKENNVISSGTNTPTDKTDSYNQSQIDSEATSQTLTDEPTPDNSDFNKSVYDYMDSLLKSDKNPANFVEIPGIPLNENPADKKYADELKAWNKSCDKYEKKQIRKLLKNLA